MLSIAEELEQKTVAYWKLSSVWNRRIERHITMGEAIELCVTIDMMTSVHRPLATVVDKLREELINGEGPPPYLIPATISILPTNKIARS